MNLETEGGPRQADLFDTGGEKERKLEEAILELNKKFPNAALRRGRSWMQDE